MTKDVTNPAIAIVTLNNPEKLNALTVAMGEEFKAVAEDLAKGGRDLRAVVVTGSGRAFSAGGDLDFLNSRVAIGAPLTPESDAENKQCMLDFYARFLAIKKVPVPVISAINGPAVGAGLCLAMAADMRIVAHCAKLSVNFVKIGIHPGMAASYHLPRLVGPQQAARMILTGDVVTGEEAVKIGLCLESVPKDEVLETALALARKICRSTALPINQATATIREGMRTLEDATDRESSSQAQNFGIGGAAVVEGLSGVAKKK